MDVTSVRPNGRVVRWDVLRLLAATVVGVQHTHGSGERDDYFALNAVERAVWLELAIACPDRAERDQLIAEARGSLVAPGAPSCRRAARLLVQAGGVLLSAAAGLSAAEGERMERCARSCGEVAVRLERIAFELGGL